MVSPPGDHLARVGQVGPFFHIHPGPRPDPEGFRPLGELYGEGPALASYTAFVARRLGTDQTRVAASTVQLGLASRLWSVALASASLAGRVPDLDPARVWWCPNPAGPLRLWLPEPRDLPADGPTGLAGALHATVVEANLRPLGDAVRELARVSWHSLHGNAASALVGGLRVLADARPDVRATAVTLAEKVLRHPPLADAGTVSPAPDGLALARHNCCLYYRVPGGGTCGDCVLRHRSRTAHAGR
ncbi:MULTISPECIES: (2Fe-2S)-binding protein [unclassified Streptomyces]|uniref:(2Fe-2S)-binding protein n=1 Tax=unclassified Streptomyces TaxID=2593676 RepID=UPI0022B5FB04|nr:MULTISPECIES: (2Fe-2S)-binding protein [unclassified Streptomyces]MCZ7415413.1 (2Fe-2S)-binding protein [Streptomyces sp. WMMC897]MCZ7417853.1 (2Fe-2S)-binding protein [Streptomyces sp. WMMC897]MCZ7417879.1 (2Fe-2S)-binding protein [Streptomyces sp. WMMC897]MCZ7432342.1 (2Fe-2S)-binding protein [Streptomyces sp. WMMC1477]